MHDRSHDEDEDEPLREDEVTRGDKLDDRVEEGEGLRPEEGEEE